VAKANNLSLNGSRTVEIVITDRKRNRSVSRLPSLPDIGRASIIKMFGVTVSSRLSVSDHVTNLISNCSQTLYALTILRAHGLCDIALQSLYSRAVYNCIRNLVYRSVIIARLLFASSAWCGFTSSFHWLWRAAFIHRGVRRGFCTADLLSIDELQCVSKKWRQNSNHYNYGTSYQN